MKKLVVLFLIVLFIPLAGYSQSMRHQDMGPMKKIEELEKIKLIDVLGMNEETTLRFFARRSKFKDEQRKLFGQENDLIGKMEDAVKSGKSNDSDLKSMISQYFDLENQIVNAKQKFINSLPDILSYKQISELLVFEKRFREEIRSLLFRERMKRKP
jgi:hypothetical protein